MITEFIQRWDVRSNTLKEKYSKKHPESYVEIVNDVVGLLKKVYPYASPDNQRIHEIDDGDYQGNKLFVFASDQYQPSEYWSVMVSYGSCSGCDTLQDIRGYTDEPPTGKQVAGYMTLALHIMQEIKKIY